MLCFTSRGMGPNFVSLSNLMSKSVTGVRECVPHVLVNIGVMGTTRESEWSYLLKEA